jgi:chloramphenicol 3-O phosphotransferase
MTTIVLNGPSSAGKSTLAAELQRQWTGHLLMTGIDTFLAGCPGTFFSLPEDDGTAGPTTDGFRVVPGAGPAPSWVPMPGSGGLRLLRAAHRAWRAVNDTGLDQVIDHVLPDSESKFDARQVLRGPQYLWVGVHCDPAEAVRREAARGDRLLGLAAGTSAVVHHDMTYDVSVDTTTKSAAELAQQLLRSVRIRHFGS